MICEAKEYYQRRINKYNKLIEKEEKHLKNIIMLRLLTVILGAVCLITTYLLRQSYIFLFYNFNNNYFSYFLWIYI